MMDKETQIEQRIQSIAQAIDDLEPTAEIIARIRRLVAFVQDSPKGGGNEAL